MEKENDVIFFFFFVLSFKIQGKKENLNLDCKPSYKVSGVNRGNRKNRFKILKVRLA